MGLTQKAVLRHLNTIKREYVKAYKEAIQYPNMECQFYLNDSCMPVTRWDTEGSNWRDYSLNYLTTINGKYWELPQEYYYQNGRIKACVFIREFRDILESECEVHINEFVKRRCAE